MIPESLLSYEVRAGALVPRFLDAADHPWLRALLDEYERCTGRPERDFRERLRDPVAPGARRRAQRLAARVLDQLAGPRRPPSARPRSLRAALFGAAAGVADYGAPGVRARVVAQVAAQHHLVPAALEAALFADLPGARPLPPLPRPVGPDEVRLRANLLLAQGLIFRATGVAIEVEGNARDLVRHARLRRLLCTVAPRTHAGAARLELSGPLALFRRTLLYGRALAELVPRLAWCHRFQLRAECVVDSRRATLTLATGDPLFPAAPPRRFDSRLEERFARDFLRAAPDWDLVREPEPLRAGAALVFPDFALQHRHDPARRYLLEIVGFWTPDYVARKLARLRAAAVGHLVLCIDEERQCADGDLPPGAIVRYRRRIDPAAVLAALAALGDAGDRPAA